MTGVDRRRLHVTDRLRQLGEVARVRFEGVGGESALDAEMVEVRVDPAVEPHATRP